MLLEKDILSDLPQIREVEASSLGELQALMSEDVPFVVRGYVSHWPLVKQSQTSIGAVRDYLLSKAKDIPLPVTVGPPDNQGRIFYRDDMAMNISMGRAKLSEVFERMSPYDEAPEQPTIYLGSVNMRGFFDGLVEDNPMDLGQPDMLESIWIGTRTRIAAHNDFPDNLACVAAGTRRFTLFPPSEFRNLYIGPIDFTPAGRAVSMVDFYKPDFEKHPKFRDALAAGITATLEPGDAIFIPSMWWHHVEGLSPFNVLVNYWWRETPRYLGSPQNALNHAILAIRELPEHERAHWRDMFDYYVFEGGAEVTDHIPETGRGVLAPLDSNAAARLRGYLLKTLNDE